MFHVRRQTHHAERSRRPAHDHVDRRAASSHAGLRFLRAGRHVDGGRRTHRDRPRGRSLANSAGSHWRHGQHRHARSNQNRRQHSISAGGENGYLQGDAVGTFVNKSGTVRGLAAVQYDTRDQFDADDNGVSESPFTENTNYSGRLSFDPTPRSTVTIRAGHIDGEILRRTYAGRSGRLHQRNAQRI